MLSAVAHAKGEILPSRHSCAKRAGLLASASGVVVTASCDLKGQGGWISGRVQVSSTGPSSSPGEAEPSDTVSPRWSAFRAHLPFCPGCESPLRSPVRSFKRVLLSLRLDRSAPIALYPKGGWPQGFPYGRAAHGLDSQPLSPRVLRGSCQPAPNATKGDTTWTTSPPRTGSSPSTATWEA